MRVLLTLALVALVSACAIKQPEYWRRSDANKAMYRPDLNSNERLQRDLFECGVEMQSGKPEYPLATTTRPERYVDVVSNTNIQYRRLDGDNSLFQLCMQSRGWEPARPF